MIRTKFECFVFVLKKTFPSLSFQKSECDSMMYDEFIVHELFLLKTRILCMIKANFTRRINLYLVLIAKAKKYPLERRALPLKYFKGSKALDTILVAGQARYFQLF